MTPPTAVQPAAPTRPTAIPLLDSVRGCAVIAVMLFHAAEMWPDPVAGVVERSLNRVALAGWAGVDVFFVLSGFLITRILLAAVGDADYYSRFWTRRILRIFPPYYALLLCTFFIWPLVYPAARQSAVFGQGPWYWLYLQNWVVGATGWPVGSPLHHTWSLAIEEQFYLFWPVAVACLSRRALSWVCVGGVVVAPLLRTLVIAQAGTIAAYVITPTRLDALFGGALVALLIAQGVRLGRRGWALGGAACAGLLVLAVWRHGLESSDPMVEIAGFSLLVAANVALVWLIAERNPPRLGPVEHLFAAAGRVSYAAYLVHYPVMRVVYAIFPTIDGPLSRINVVALSIGSTFVIAAASWVTLEQPFAKLKELLSQKMVLPSAD